MQFVIYLYSRNNATDVNPGKCLRINNDYFEKLCERSFIYFSQLQKNVSKIEFFQKNIKIITRENLHTSGKCHYK